MKKDPTLFWDTIKKIEVFVAEHPGFQIPPAFRSICGHKMGTRNVKKGAHCDLGPTCLYAHSFALAWYVKNAQHKSLVASLQKKPPEQQQRARQEKTSRVPKLEVASLSPQIKSTPSSARSLFDLLPRSMDEVVAPEEELEEFGLEDISIIPLQDDLATTSRRSDPANFFFGDIPLGEALEEMPADDSGETQMEKELVPFFAELTTDDQPLESEEAVSLPLTPREHKESGPLPMTLTDLYHMDAEKAKTPYEVQIREANQNLPAFYERVNRLREIYCQLKDRLGNQKQNLCNDIINGKPCRYTKPGRNCKFITDVALYYAIHGIDTRFKTVPCSTRPKHTNAIQECPKNGYCRFLHRNEPAPTSFQE